MIFGVLNPEKIWLQ